VWINESKTLWEDRNRDTWQLPLFSSDGIYCGNVVAQVVDPHQCMVRYFIVFSRQNQRQFLVPSDAVELIDQKVQCSVRACHLRQIPKFCQTVSPQLESDVYRAIESKPYWE
jgi:hypothetical protein